MEYSTRFTGGVPLRQCGVVCDDGVELMGLVLDPPGIQGDGLLGAVLFLPGQYDNAYQQRLNHFLVEWCASVGLGCVLANNRGQDYYGYQRRYESRGRDFVFDDYSWDLLGSTFELVRDSLQDTRAWLHYIANFYGSDNVTLVGHSHGAIKVANYALMTDAGRIPSVSRIALLSPSDDIGAQKQTLGERYEEALSLARDLVEHGNEKALMPDWAHSSPMSARTYLEAFGPESPLTTFALHAPEASPLRKKGGWRTRTLVLYGEDDSATAGMNAQNACNLIKSWFESNAHVDTVVLPGANHHYMGSESEAAQTICDWIIGR